MLIIFAVLFSFFSYSCESSAQENDQKLDPYGGYLNIKTEPTGRFYVKELDDRYFLITPEGHGFISLGVTHTGGLLRGNAEEAEFFKTVWMGNHEKAAQVIKSNLLSWGYNSLGYDSNFKTPKILPFMADCYTSRNSLWKSKKDFHFEDVFSDDWKKEAKLKIQAMVRESKDSPFLIGYYWTDMPAWDLDYAKRTMGSNWVDYIRSLPVESPGKKRYLEFLADNAGKENDQLFLRLIAKEYYKCIGEETRRLAPKSLIFGERYQGRALNYDIVKEALPYIDVVSVQPSGVEFMEKEFDKLHEISGKPILICDHQCSFPTADHSKTIWKQLESVEAVNQAHNEYFELAFSKPYMIGYHRCQYINRYKKGKLKQGLIQSNGEPYKGLVENVLKANKKVHSKFLHNTQN